MKNLRLLLSGRVQGVGFRAFTRREARRLGLRGWVENLPDGRVEVRVSGDDESVDELRDRLAEGPRPGRVDRVEATELAEPGELEKLDDFDVRY